MNKEHSPNFDDIHTILSKNCSKFCSYRKKSHDFQMLLPLFDSVELALYYSILIKDER